jgi:hypothetical protein
MLGQDRRVVKLVSVLVDWDKGPRNVIVAAQKKICTYLFLNLNFFMRLTPS